MNRIKTALLASLLILTSQLAQASSSQPEIFSVLFYADWCGSCRVIDPAIAKARGQSDLDNKPVLFVRLDLTDATKRNQSRLMAHALGLSDFYEKNAGKTGFMVLVDAETKTILSTITKASDAKAITTQITNAIATASS